MWEKVPESWLGEQHEPGTDLPREEPGPWPETGPLEGQGTGPLSQSLTPTNSLDSKEIRGLNALAIVPGLRQSLVT